MKKTKIIGSSSIDEIRYDESKKELEVEFFTTGGYRYSHVSVGEYGQIMDFYNAGGSIGSMLRKVVKGKEYINLRKELLE